MTSLSMLIDDKDCLLIHSLAKFYYTEVGRKEKREDDSVFIVKCYVKAIENVLNKKGETYAK